MPLSSNFENDIEVIVSNRPDALTRPSKQTRNVHLTAVPVQNRSKHIHVAVLNIQSACNKVDQISDYIQESKSDVLFLSETWISENNNYTCDQFTPSGYSTHHIPRKGRPGGGVVIVTKNTLRANPIDSMQFCSFEHGAARLKSKDKYITVVIVYRTPGHVNQQFLLEFSQLLERHTLTKDRILICGDFNIHFDNISDTSVTHFKAILNEFGLTQHVFGPTHISGHTLDLVITRSDDDLLQTKPNTTQLFSDHYAIEFECNLDIECDSAHAISFRKISKIDISAFNSDISGLDRNDYSSMDIESLVNLYDSTLRSALDKHAPLVSKKVKCRTIKPWIDHEVLSQRTKRRKLERVMRKTRTDQSLVDFKTQKNLVNHLTETKKISFFNSAIAKCNGNQKGIYNLLRRSSNKQTKPVYPYAPSDEVLANQFSDFFKA